MDKPKMGRDVAVGMAFPRLSKDGTTGTSMTKMKGITARRVPTWYFYPHMLITRMEAVTAPGTMIVGTFQSHGGPARLRSSWSGVRRSTLPATRTTKACTGFIGKVGVETPLNSVGCEPQSTLPQKRIPEPPNPAP